jgi:hypothetical protein
VLTDPLGNQVVAGGSATTGVAGSYTLNTPPLNLAGVWQVDLTVTGADPYRSATRHEAVSADGLGTAVTLNSSAPTVIYGSSETLTAHLTGYAAGNTTARIHRVVGTVDTVIGSGAVDADGDFAVTFVPKRNATYWAEHQSDDTYNPARSTNVAVKVEPIISGAFASRHGSSGGYALFTYRTSCAAQGTSCPLFSEHLLPSSPGITVQMVVQQRTVSGWKTVAVWSHKLNSLSRWTFKIRYVSTSVIGKRYRVIAASKRTSKLAASAWGYWYFRILR